MIWILIAKNNEAMFYLNHHCYVCQLPFNGKYLGICRACIKRLSLSERCCLCCGLPLVETKQTICATCLITPPIWQSLSAVNDYSGRLKQLLWAFKYHKQVALAPLLSLLILHRWLAMRRAFSLIKPDVIISVPLHKHRHWQRGFNQTELLAKQLAYWLNCQWHPLWITRIKATAIQQQLTAEQRQRNLLAAFQLNRSVAGLNVVLLDDVVTTGATLTEIGRLLKQQGVGSIQVWCLCRTFI